MRRTRIKGIANIPQRKKTDLPEKNDEGSIDKTEVSNTSGDGKNNQSPKVSHDNNSNKGPEYKSPSQIILIDQVLKKPKKLNVQNVKTPSSQLHVSKNCEESSECSDKNRISVLENKVILTAPGIKTDSSTLSASQSSIVGIMNEEKKTLLSRRRMMKPAVTARAINKRNDKVVNPCGDTKNNEEVTLDLKPPLKVADEPPSSPLSSSPHGTRQIKSPINPIAEAKKVIFSYANPVSDQEYPIPPASPNKVNRARIKAIPRIGYRKISFSASESEDETKKSYNRTRNDSQSSSISVQETLPEHPTTPKQKEFSSVIQRKCKRTEWSRKLSEARREFTRKFITGKPDHKKLTMIDLIFYNPSTNTMQKEHKKSISETEATSVERQEEEAVDNPSEKEDDPSEKNETETTKLSDEEAEIPTPQIKIGPSGEIILDEKSIVIENKKTKKDREELQKSKIIDGNSDRPYGVFKKVKRSKDWTHSETLRFYKALSTIGTDFSLMCELFPQRTRRELKMKFKKEEKMNQTLIDKAVMEPCSFDFEELKKEFELVEIERKELERQRIEEDKLRKSRSIKKSIKLMKFVNQESGFTNISSDDVSTTNPPSRQNDQNEVIESEEVNRSDVEDAVVEKMENKSEQVKRKQRKQPNFLKKIRRKKLDIMNVLSDSDSVNSETEETEIIWRPTQTRYGRNIRKREIYEPDAGMVEEFITPRKIQRPDPNTEVAHKPGSLMMVSTKTPDGQPIVKIFMVTDKIQDGEKSGEENISTENLLPLAMIQTGPNDDEREVQIENNYTIAAQPQDPLADPQCKQETEEGNIAEIVEQNIT